MGQSFVSIDYVKEPTPLIRYTSGLALYEEALVDTRWIGRYWSPIGRIELDPAVPGELVHNSAFGLEIDGQSLHRDWQLDGCDSKEPERDGQQHFVVTLRHQVRPVALYIHTVLDGTPVVTRWLEIQNTGTKPAALSSLWVWSGRVFPCQMGSLYYGSPLPFRTAHGNYTLGSFVDNKWGTEGHFQWRELGRETVEIGEESGKSGWGHPIAYMRDEQAGHIFVIQLAWSGNWAIRIEPKETGRRPGDDKAIFLRVGPRATAPMRVLAPGETVRTPEVHFGGMAGDLVDMVQGLHEHQRRSVLLAPPDGCANLVIYNNWGYMKHEMDEDKLIHAIDIAADLGAEVFDIDAGWYGREGEPWQITGNWLPGDRLPNGLKPVFDYAHGKGLKRGLWVWIEAASEGSPIIQQHPDWLLQRDGRHLENMLDLAKPEVAKWVESEIIRIVEKYDIDLFRLDYNASPGEGGYNLRHGYAENTIWRHYEAMYGIWEHVREQFPNLILENCAGGGGRTDLGMLSRFHYTQMSDHFLEPRSLRIHNGLMLAIPPELLMRFNGVTMNAHLGGDLDMQMRASILVGNPVLTGIWPTLEDKNPVALDKIRHAVDLFKQHVRPMIRTCHVYHHTPEIIGDQPGGWCVFEYASPDAYKAIAGIFRLAGESAPEYTLKFRGLSSARQYRIWSDNKREALVVPGKDLVELGVVVGLPRPMTSELLLVTEIESNSALV